MKTMGKWLSGFLMLFALSFVGARAQLLDEGVGRIRFFPDGSSTGGLIRLVQGNARADVRSDWLTGLVTVDVAVE